VENSTRAGLLFHKLSTEFAQSGIDAPMSQTTAEKIFSRDWSTASRTVRATLELDEQVVAMIDTWAGRRGLTFEHVMAQAAGQIAGAVLRDECRVARDLKIDRSILEELDLQISLDFDQISLERKIKDRSIRPESPACGKLCAFSSERANSAMRREIGMTSAEPEKDRAREFLHLYRALTGNRIKPADQAALARVFHYPDQVIRAGILHALYYSTRQIGSFAYCVRAMDNFVSHPDLDGVILMLVGKLQEKRKAGQLVLPLEGEKLLVGEFKTELDKRNSTTA
jgi:hypothetical protein